MPIPNAAWIAGNKLFVERRSTAVPSKFPKKSAIAMGSPIAKSAMAETTRFPSTRETPNVAMAAAPMMKIPVPTILEPNRRVNALANRIPARPPNGNSITKSPIWAVFRLRAC